MGVRRQKEKTMGLFDDVKLNHDMFGEDKGTSGQTKDFPDPYLEKYEITEAGRLVKPDFKYEDKSDPNAPKGSIASIRGMLTPVYSGTFTDMYWHGYLDVGDWRCKFTDGQLVSAEKIT